MTGDLVAFLRARLDEDEADARCAFGDHNDDGPEWTEVSSGALSTGFELHPIGDSAIARHMERWDPARVLAEVDAKRRILDHLIEQIERSDHPWWFEDSVAPVLRLLALPYAAHPDYQPAWAPEEGRAVRTVEPDAAAVSETARAVRAKSGDHLWNLFDRIEDAIEEVRPGFLALPEEQRQAWIGALYVAIRALG